MTKIETKYSVGDTVFLDIPEVRQRKLPCPDCLGQKVWKTTSPAGTDYEFCCPRCSGVYQSDKRLSLDYSEYVPNIRTLTIGSVQTDSHDGGGLIKYMCQETGVGSGSVYREGQLHATEDEAEIASAAHANKLNNDPSDFVLPLYNSRLAVSDYELKQLPKEKKKKKK